MPTRRVPSRVSGTPNRLAAPAAARYPMAMKLVRHGPPGAEKPGILAADGSLRDLSGELDDLSGAALAPESLARLAALDPQSLPPVAGDVRLGPPVGRVGKCIGVGLNYADHAAEANMPAPAEPILFTKADTSICGPTDDLILPADAGKCDWEVELAVVIGTEARRIDEAQALDHVAGYAVIDDVSERAYQIEGTGQWLKGKSCDTFGPLGPWLVTTDEVGDPQDLRLWTKVNGESMQDGTTATMIFPVRTLVSYISRFMTLRPGDVIATGTPPGVGMGRKPQVWLQPGDVLEVGIDGLGAQKQRVRRAD
jgi:2-keto-4-pentenoate hydratase/2-oxohepta-3-ene-1,7-dioic acid hydratase in catechol pathway